MSVQTDRPHQRARLRKPYFVWTTVADPHWRPLTLLRSSCGHVIGLAGVLGSRQWAFGVRRCA